MRRRMWSLAVTVPLATVVIGLAPSQVEAQDWRTRAKPSAPSRSFYPDQLARAQRIFALRGVASAVLESEPNDSTTQANVIALGDTVSASVDPAGDVDFYSVDLTAGTNLLLDIDASQLGSPLDPIMALIAPDGVTGLAFNDDRDGLDSRIEYNVPSDGRYYVGVAGFGGTGGPGYFYYLKVAIDIPPPPGPGDPTTLVATGLGGPSDMTADASGRLYVTDVGAQRLLRVDPNGGVVTTVTTDSLTQDLVLDGLGDLLVTGYRPGSGDGVIWRISVTGQRSLFADGLQYPTAITIGPDGDVWVSDVASLLRYAPTGRRKDSIFVGVYAADMAFSPAGELHLSDGFSTVSKLTGGTLQVVIEREPYLEGLAFDRDGYLYLANGFLGQVFLYDPAYQPIAEPFARSNLGGPIALVFGRDASGAMNSRLFAANQGYNLPAPYAGGIVEMNPAAMRAPGFRVGIDLLRMATTTLRAGTVGGDYADTLRLIDTAGPVTWTVSAGALPPGLSLESATGAIGGVPADSGHYAVSVRGTSGGQFGMGTFTIAVRWPSVSVTAATDGLLGVPGTLTPEFERFLDLQGNNNGRYDVGDFRAYLRRQGQLPSGAAARVATVDRRINP